MWSVWSNSRTEAEADPGFERGFCLEEDVPSGVEDLDMIDEGFQMLVTVCKLYYSDAFQKKAMQYSPTGVA